MATFIRVPKFLRPLSSLVKRVIRQLVYLRLGYLPLTLRRAEWWAETVKAWPALFGGTPFVKRMPVPPGLVMELGITDVIQRTLLTDGVWDRPIARLLDRYLQLGGTFLDIGAHIGYFTLYASRLVGEGGKVIAFEPSVRALDRLTTHLCLNNCTNVVLFSVAVGEERSLETFYQATPNNIGASSLRELAHPVKKELVPVVNLDEILKGYDLRPDLIKIDTEGYELYALKGMREMLGKHKPEIISELTDNFLVELGASARDILSYMKDIGYDCYALEHREELVGYPLSPEDAAMVENQVDVLFTVRRPLFRIVEGNR